ncbi:AAA family ATPase [Allobranchiibius sp. CTAmp26]|uniref:AAA family ATPase n=1 Tax=Allobranchiibius sp. CTAmp26 TaxID=2815214 RepID=UPI001AA15903|nr:AAA family ATPase [Allobranchiibius sp. CTAmp26]MBO1755503.1 AAA family ATPase [Allobranchiibius sp. CTAmp26]
MSDIVLATASADFEERVRRATGGMARCLPPGPLPVDPAHLFLQLGDGPRPEVVVLDDAAGAPGQALALADLFQRQCPDIAVVVVSDAGDAIALPAMRAGVRDVLDPAAEEPHIRWVLERAGQLARHTQAFAAAGPSAPGAEEGRRGGRVIGVVSPKGGVGKTTVATNLAIGLAQKTSLPTVLVDLDVQFGDVASALNLDPEHSLIETVHGPATRDTMVLKTFLTQHASGLYVICGPPTPAAADNVTGQDVSRLLEMLASEFAWVVVDTAPGLSEHTLAALDRSTDLVLMTGMDVPGVRGLRKELDILGELGMIPDRHQVVLNFADRHSGLSTADVEATIGTGVDLVLPRSKAVPTSVNQGIPLLQSGVRDPMTKQLRRLVEQFTASAAPTADRGRVPIKAPAAPRPEPVLAVPRSEPVLAVPRSEPVLVTPRPEPVLAAPRPEAALAVPRPEPVLAAPRSEAALSTPKRRAPRITSESGRHRARARPRWAR